MLCRPALTLLLALPTAAIAAPAHYPLTVENCGKALTFTQAPQRAVTIGQAGTEMLYALGLGDRLVGTSLWFDQVQPEYAAQNAKVERLADNEPSFEAVLAKRPQLVAVQFEWMVGPQGAVGTREQFHDLNIPTYLLPSDCEGKDNLKGADGTRLETFDIASVYKSVRQLAEIFDVTARGDALVEQYKARLAQAVTRTRQHPGKDVSAVVWFSSADIASDPFVAGKKGVADFMLNTLGIHNVVESNEEWPTVGWETLARANPSLIVIARMDRRRFPADDYEKKLAFLKTDPVTRNMDAVKNDRIVILDADAMQASTRLFTGIEQLAEASERYAR
ncbi:ABC transporter substrate-binding protein [Pseudomonas sp. Marseille-Q5115]|uniref:ABC transporter substrate-binding protein n=1 Tax=Pseudomonas sp. Marseille-Q5115 TaxID=2866593 RepID=UPI001CE3FD00|nr:ABC transporter substrate-binding protein [Pseudomonas sp. Marseille-Q5115]